MPDGFTSDVALRPVLEERIAEGAATQHGVLTRRQLQILGLTSRAVQSWVGSRRLRRLHRGVYLLGHLRGPLEPGRAREMAAVLACGPGAVLSHRSAAWLWELLQRSSNSAAIEVDVTVPRRARRQRPGIRIHRSDDLAVGETSLLDGIPLTTPGRTIRDLSTVLGRRELNRLAARAERRGLIDAAEMASLVARQRGRAGAPLLRAAIGSEDGPILTRSEAEEIPRPRTRRQATRAGSERRRPRL